jgi:hypothetical protein
MADRTEDGAEFRSHCLCVGYEFLSFFLFFLPSVAFRSLPQPSFAFIGKGCERGFGGVFGRPTRAAWAGKRRLRVAGGGIDCAYVSHA